MNATTLNYAQQSRNPARHLTAISVVVLLHLIIAYALINGLARKVVEIYQKPVEVAILADIPTQVIEQQQTPPPPPPPPKPRPVIQPPKPKPPAPRPKIPVAVTPAPVTSVAPSVASGPPRPVSVGVVCPNHLAVRSRVPYPPLALQQGLNGEVLIEFTVGVGGEIGNVQVLKSSNAMFERAASGAVRGLRCVGQGQPVRVRVPFAFRVER
jgi:protein TonB